MAAVQSSMNSSEQSGFPLAAVSRIICLVYTIWIFLDMSLRHISSSWIYDDSLTRSTKFCPYVLNFTGFFHWPLCNDTFHIEIDKVNEHLAQRAPRSPTKGLRDSVCHNNSRDQKCSDYLSWHLITMLSRLVSFFYILDSPLICHGSSPRVSLEFDLPLVLTLPLGSWGKAVRTL